MPAMEMQNRTRVDAMAPDPLRPVLRAEIDLEARYACVRPMPRDQRQQPIQGIVGEVSLDHENTLSAGRAGLRSQDGIDIASAFGEERREMIEGRIGASHAHFLQSRSLAHPLY
jgi:hypothetical protein